jgi:hypothetical protein
MKQQNFHVLLFIKDGNFYAAIQKKLTHENFFPLKNVHEKRERCNVCADDENQVSETLDVEQIFKRA